VGTQLAQVIHHAASPHSSGQIRRARPIAPDDPAPESLPSKKEERGKQDTADTELQAKLIEHLQDAHAMEQGVLRSLDALIATSFSRVIIEALKQHKMQTEQHAERLRSRLEELGHHASGVEDLQTVGAALIKGVGDQMRSDKPFKNARDAYMTEYMEVATYEMLERMATLLGDTQTAQIAQLNRSDELWMAEQIAANWDRFVDLTLAETGVPGGPMPLE